MSAPPNSRPTPRATDAAEWWRVGVVALLAAAAAPAQAPPGYYATVDPSDALTLRRTLHAVVDDHVRYPYTASSTDTWDILELADEHPTQPSRILDVYRNAAYAKVGGGNSSYNREHTWPKSYGFPLNRSDNYPYTDCHQLFLCDAGYNSSRSNKPFDQCDPTCSEKPTLSNAGSGGGSGSYPGNSDWTQGALTAGSWETWRTRRGDVARALLYLDVRYEGGRHGVTGAGEPDLILTDDVNLIAAGSTGQNLPVAHMGLLSVLLQWHAADPVDDRERRRNDVVFLFQGNRNPFVDHPGWVDCLFAGRCPPAPPWINELRYDGATGDLAELVEVAGRVGVDLAGWRLTVYDGATGGVQRQVALAGRFADQQNGFGTLVFALPLANGRTGLALVDPQGLVAEFLSYEGSFSASNGPAAGRAAVDIGTMQPPTARAESSLQRAGVGGSAASFLFEPPQRATPGRVNPHQTLR